MLLDSSIPQVKRRRFRPPSRRCCCGSVTLELAILLPILLSLMLLAVDFGRFATTFIDVTNAAREGAGFGSFHPVTPATKPNWDAAIRASVLEELGTGYLDADLVMPAPVSIDEGNGFRRVSVDVSYPFQTIINWPFFPGYANQRMIRRVVVMRGIR